MHYSIITDSNDLLPHGVYSHHGYDLVCQARFLYLIDAEAFKNELTKEKQKWQDSQEVAEATDVLADKTDAFQSEDA